MAGFGGSVKLTGEAAYRQALQAIAADLKNVAAQQKLTAASYDKSDNSLTALSKRSEELKNKLAAQQEKVKTLTAALKDYQSQQEKNKTTIQSLQTQLDKEKEKLAEIEKQYGKNSKEYEQQAKVVADLEKELKKANTQFEKNETTVKKTQAALTSAEADVKKTGAAMQKLGQQAEEAGVGADKLGVAVDESGKKAQTAANGGYTVFKNMLANLASQVITRAVDGVKNLGRAVYDAGVDFDAAMSKVQAVSGASAEDMKKLTAKAKEMGETTKFSAAESAEALNYMAMAGWKTEDMLNGLEGIMNLAAASGSDLATTSDIVTDALTAMGYSAGDAGRLADVMAAASSNANTNVEMMGETFKYAATVAGSLGYSMEDVAVATGLMANAGVKGERAGTALRSIMQRLATDTGGAATAMHEMGVQTTNADGTMRPLGDVMSDLRKKMAGLSDEQKTATAKTIAGTEAMGGLLAIVNATETDYNKLTLAVQNSSGAAQKMADTMQNNVGGQMTKLKSQLEGIYLTIWNKVEPVISKTIASISNALKNVNWDDFGKKAGQALEKIAKGFEWLIKNKDTVISAIKLMIAAFATAKILSFAQGLSNVLTNLTAVAKGTAVYSTALGGLTAAQTASTTATTLGTAAVNLFNAAWKANPIGLVVTALTLLAGGIMAATNALENNNSEQVKHKRHLKELSDEIKASSDSWKELQETQQKSLNQGMTEITHYRALKSELDGIVDKNGKVKSGYEERARFLTGELANALGVEISMQDGVVQGYEKIASSIDTLIEKKKAEIILESQQEAYTTAINNRAEAYKNYAEIKTEYDKQMTIVEQKMDEARQKSTLNEQSLDALRSFYMKKYVGDLQNQYDDASNLLGEYTYTVSTYENNMAAFHNEKWNEIKAANWELQKDYQSTGDAQKAELEANMEFEKGYSEYLVRNRQKLGEDVYNTEYKASQERLKLHESDMKKYVESTENHLKDNGKAWIENAATVLSKLTGNNIEFRRAGDGNVQMYIDGVAAGEPMAEAKAEQIVRGVISEFDERAAAEGAGQDTISGFINGVGNFSLQNTAFSIARNFGSNILNNIKSALGIGSPSKYTKQYGRWLLQGLGIGMEDEQKTIITEAKEFGDELINTLSGALEQGVSTKALTALQTALPTEFSANIGTNTSRMANVAQSENMSLVGQFKTALAEMKIEMDDREFGRFVDNTVTRLVYN